MWWWLPILALIGGLMALVWSADKFLTGAASTALHFGVSRMMIGLTVVAVGTSAPEILVSFTAAFSGNLLLAFGNAIGSNIVNIGLVLGATAILAPLPFSQRVLRAELPWLLGATLLTLILLFDLKLEFYESLILLGGLGVVLYLLVHTQANAPEASDGLSDELDELTNMSTKTGMLWLVLGLAVLIASARLLVWAATEIAYQLGVSELIIGLTIVAVGTSLPELATTIGAAIKGYPDIAIGNVVGSNILNVLAVLAVPGLVDTIHIESAALWRDCGMMLALTLMLALFAYGINSRPVITRFEGLVLLLAWVGYNILLVQQSSPSAA